MLVEVAQSGMITFFDTNRALPFLPPWPPQHLVMLPEAITLGSINYASICSIGTKYFAFTLLYLFLL